MEYIVQKEDTAEYVYMNILYIYGRNIILGIFIFISQWFCHRFTGLNWLSTSGVKVKVKNKYLPMLGLQESKTRFTMNEYHRKL